MTTAIDRRRLLTASAGLVAGLALPARALGVGVGVGAASELPAADRYAAARKDTRGRFSAVIFDAGTGRELASVTLPGRGHDLAVRPGTAGREVIAFARRPGTFAVVFGPDRQRTPLWFASRPDRYFYGHGVFSRDGRLLYTTENDFEAGAGVIGVRDATAGYKQIGELPAGGIGSHELALLSDGRTLVVANGGIKTHPDTPRLELNIATMQPSLAYVDTERAEVVEVHRLPAGLHQLSIRHLAVGQGDTVLFGCQYRGPGWQTQAIVGRHRRGRELEQLALPADTLFAMRNYVASLAVDRAGEVAVIAAPRGGLAVAVDVASGRQLARQALDDVFGIAPRRPEAGGGFVMTSGNGTLAAVSDMRHARLEPQSQDKALAAAWDDHLIVVE